MRLLGRLIVPALLVAAGWYGGARWGAPEFVFSAVDSVVSRIIGLAGSAGESPASDSDEASSDPPADVIEPVADGGDNTPASKANTQTAPGVSDDGGDDGLVLCNTSVSNAPPANADGRVTGWSPLVQLNGVSLLVKPATSACLSSGFGHRGYSPHRGVDYFSDAGGDVLASGDGVIREATYRDDYGNTIVIDHGSGIVTRYAHLASFASAVREGGGVKRGQRLGPIGQTGRTSAPHLHFEIRTGDYSNQAGIFGLKPVDPFSL